MGSEFDQQNEAKIIMSKENMELNKQVEQLGGALKKKSREVAQIQRRADLQVAGEKMERARVQAIVIADKKREQKSNKRQQKRLKEELETTQRSLEEAREEKREEEKQTAAAERNQKKAMRKVAVLEQDISDMKVVVEYVEDRVEKEREKSQKLVEDRRVATELEVHDSYNYSVLYHTPKIIPKTPVENHDQPGHFRTICGHGPNSLDTAHAGCL